MSFFFFKQKTAYELRISDWSSDVCSSDLRQAATGRSAYGGRGSDMTMTLTILTAIALSAVPILLLCIGDPKRRRSAEKNSNGMAKIGRASCRERVCQYV